LKKNTIWQSFFINSSSISMKRHGAGREEGWRGWREEM
jgi:hypothetical protein